MTEADDDLVEAAVRKGWGLTAAATLSLLALLVDVSDQRQGRRSVMPEMDRESSLRTPERASIAALRSSCVLRAAGRGEGGGEASRRRSLSVG